MTDEYVSFEVETNLPTEFGVFRVRAYRDLVSGHTQLALISGDISTDAPLVRVHSECLTGEALGSMKCECGPQLEAALTAIKLTGGVVIYMRGHEGRGIGLLNKLRAYALQEQGFDTVDANLQLGLPEDARVYHAATAILKDLGVHKVSLMTNNPDKIAKLTEDGIEVATRVPLEVGINRVNEGYLRSKRDRMGHLFGTEAIDEQD